MLHVFSKQLFALNIGVNLIAFNIGSIIIIYSRFSSYN